MIFPFRNMEHKTNHIESIIYLNDLFEEALKCLTFLERKMCWKSVTSEPLISHNTTEGATQFI